MEFDPSKCTIPTHPPDCKGPGNYEHIKQFYAESSEEELRARLAKCCGKGGKLISIKSVGCMLCGCSHAVYELHRRGLWDMRADAVAYIMMFADQLECYAQEENERVLETVRANLLEALNELVSKIEYKMLDDGEEEYEWMK
jgi:hypothetical protein